MESAFVELFSACESDGSAITLSFAKRYVFGPLRTILDCVETGGHRLESVDRLKSVNVGVHTARVQCSVFTPVSDDNLMTVGMLEKIIKDNLPSKCTLVKIVYSAEMRGFLSSIEFQFDDETIARLDQKDFQLVCATELVNSGGDVITSLPIAGEKEKDALLTKRRKLDEESKVAEGELRKVRSRREYNQIVGISNSRAKGAAHTAVKAKSEPAPTRESHVRPTKQIYVTGRRNAPKPPISKTDKKTKAKVVRGEETSEEVAETAEAPSIAPSVFARSLPFVNRILCAVAGVDTTNEESQEYEVSHRYHNDLFIQK